MFDLRRFGFRRERLLASYVPWAEYVQDNVLVFDDGSAFCMFAVDGLPFETVEEDVVWYQHGVFEHALRNVATHGLIFHALRCRGIVDDRDYPEGVFRTEFAERIDAKYRSRLFGGRRMWLNQTYFGIQLRPRRFAGEWIGERLAQQTRRFEDDESIGDRVDRLLRIAGVLREQLKVHKLRFLRIQKRGKALFSEIAEAVAFAMTGYWRQVPLTANSAKSVFSEKFFVGWETFEVRMPHASTYGACLGVHDYPHMSWPGMFSSMLSASYRHTVFNVFRCFNPTEGLEVTTRKQNRMRSAGDRALGQLKELDEAANLIASNRMMMGAHGFAFTVFADDPKRLPEVVEKAWGDLSSGGANVEREDIALEAVLFSQVPGNFHLRGRPAAVSSRNFCAFAAMHDFPAGARRGYWGDPIAVLRTSGGTPFWFHLHVDGVGNTFVSGETGSGKTTWLGFLACQADRAGAQVVIWDKDRGLEALVRALEGVYSSLVNEPGRGTGLAPLRRLTDLPEDMAFLSGLIRACIATPEPYNLSPEEDRRLIIGLRTVMRRPSAERDLAEVRAFLGTSRTGAGARLEKWCWGAEFGWIIDCPEDHIAMEGGVIGFDQSGLLDDAIAAGAAMATIFHYCGRLVDGRRLIFILDEVWNALRIEQFNAEIHNGLKTFRKYNSPIVIATQSVGDALASPIAHTIREQCPSQIYFATPGAVWRDYGDEGMHCTAREFDIVRKLPKGDGTFLLKQGGKSVVVSAPLAGLDDEIAVISGTKVGVDALDIARQRSGQASGMALIEEYHKARKELAA